MANIIFHHPLPLNPQATSASGIRPLQMIKAFEALGYQVDLVTGYAQERKEKIKQIKRNIAKGVKYELVYSESSTMPTLMTEPHHLPTAPWLDFGFFRYLKQQGIKIGLFYRDIYWCFPEYENTTNKLKAKIAKWFYRYDLRKYDELVDVLYLPSLKMAHYIPGAKSCRQLELPPGHAVNAMPALATPSDANAKLTLLYVGGLSAHYKMHQLFNAMQALPNCRLVVCTRQFEWQKHGHEYQPLADNIEIVHLSGDKLAQLYQQADIALLFVQPHEYWTFAAPVKLFEYIGYTKPIIASEGTLCADIVSQLNVGWRVNYDQASFITLLQRLLAQPELLQQARAQLAGIAAAHSWQGRAAQVVKDLTAI
ncbi:glycosyltransferase [Rheinheimera pleomorphica]|uniref:glycosyltransferase n=1 Tax=Rheinheimera pleomorphica TaxID=2703963 RepID=UPI00141DF0E2|nr:glycosyltransferase [Rheinheimera pleomorphica]